MAASLMKRITSQHKVKVLISRTLTTQVNYLHSKCPKNTEWSGLLIARITKGSIEDLANLEITAEACFPMDFGDTAFTSYEGSPAYLDAFDQFPEVDPIKKEANSEWFIGKIHSHHNMEAFHSGTDTTDLYETAPKLPFFLSLVVNYSCRPFAEIAVYAETTEKVITNTKWKLKSFKNSGKDNKITTTVSPTCLVVPCEVDYEEDEWFATRVKQVADTPKVVNTPKSYYTTRYKSDPVEVPQKVYARVLSGLSDLISIGTVSEGSAYNTMMEVNKLITANLKEKYVEGVCQHFEDEWYLTHFFNMNTSTEEVINGIDKFLDLHPTLWMSNVLKDATKQLRSNLTSVQPVQGPSMVPTYSRQ